MNICVVGGGNLAHYIAAKLGLENDVVVYTRRANEWKEKVTAYDISGTSFEADRVKATNNAEEALRDATVVFITWPTNVLARRYDEIKLYIKPFTVVCFCPGYGGKEFLCRELLEKNIYFVGTQRVFSSTRVLDYGSSVECIDNRPFIKVAMLKQEDTNRICDLFEFLFKKNCVDVGNYLNITLTPSNPVLHTSRVFSLFEEYVDGHVYDEHFKFYSTWDDHASYILLKVDAEVQALCKKLEKIELDGVLSLKEHYAINQIMDKATDEQRMTEKLRSLKFLKDNAPMTACERGYIPDFKSRYFLEDFKYGLAVIQDFARIVSVDTPQIDLMMKWYKKIDKNHLENDGVSALPSKHKIFTVEDIYNFYL